VKFNPENTYEIEYTVSGHPPIRLISRGNETWDLETPIQGPCDRSRINDLLNAMTTQKTTKFTAESMDKEDLYGFNEPGLTVSLQETDSNSLIQLIIGSHSDAGGKSYYARTLGNPAVFIVESAFVEKFVPDPFHIRSKEIVKIDRSSITRLEIRTSDATFSLVRDKEAEWNMIKPRKIPTDSTVVGALLSDLEYLRATGLKTAEEEFGDVFYEIDLFETETDPVCKITIGGRPDDGVGRWIKSDRDKTVFKVSETDVERLLKDEFSFRDKTVVDILQDDLVSVTIKQDGDEFSFGPTKDTFEVLNPEDAEIGANQLEELFWTVRKIQMEGIVEETLDNLDRYGLDQPIVSLTITLKNDSIGPLHFGTLAPDSKNLYAYHQGIPLVYLVDQSSLAHLLEFNISKL